MFDKFNGIEPFPEFRGCEELELLAQIKACGKPAPSRGDGTNQTGGNHYSVNRNCYKRPPKILKLFRNKFDNLWNSTLKVKVK